MIKYNIQNISKTYTNPNSDSLTVFKDLSLTLESNQIVSIVGASGVGKSTLLHIIGSIDTPTTGSLQYSDDNTELDLLNCNESKLNNFRNSKLGFIFQFHHLLPEFTAIENVMIPAMIANAKKKDYEEKAKELLDFVGISNRASHKPKKMSGGEQQRVAIARAIINDPKILIADEPTGNLDTRNSEIISELFIRINKEFGTTILTATHSKEFALIAPIRYEMKPDGLINLS
ncbi:MAG: ABC transporter ATP-binding protein [Candidatus Kapaibacterium sp.]